MTQWKKRLWLIDAGYLRKAAQKAHYGTYLDYAKLRKKTEEQGPIWRAYYLDSVFPETREAKAGFHNWLSLAPPEGPKIITKLYEIKTQNVWQLYCSECAQKVNVACPASGEHHLVLQQQKGVDVGLATLALRHMDKFDSLVLSSGDGDLLDMIEVISEAGKGIELLVYNYGVSADLQARADLVHWIDNYGDEVLRDEPDNSDS